MKRLITFLLVFVICGTLCACNSQNLSETETIVYENCLTLKSMLKDPDSLKLYNKMFILERPSYADPDEIYTFTIFEYGASNSFGGIIKSTAVFVGDRYLCDYSELSNGDSPLYRRAKLALEEFENGDEHTKVIEINIDKIKHKLDID